jgi:hypothetical protein
MDQERISEFERHYEHLPEEELLSLKRHEGELVPEARAALETVLKNRNVASVEGASQTDATETQTSFFGFT